MDINNIEKLIKIMGDSKLSSLEIEENGLSIKMKKGNNNDTQEKILVDDNEKNTLDKIIEENKVENTEVLKEDKKEIPNEKLMVIKSPIVGTFYASPSPDKGSFVTLGSKVKKGDVLCIVEAMKLMNEIESEADGEVIEIMAEDGQMVEYGQPLFKLEMEG